MGKGALRPFFKGHSLKKEKEHEKKEVDKMLSHFVTLPPCYHPISSIPYGTDLCRYAGRSLEYPGTITGAPGQLNHSANQLRGHLPKD